MSINLGKSKILSEERKIFQSLQYYIEPLKIQIFLFTSESYRIHNKTMGNTTLKIQIKLRMPISSFQQLQSEQVAGSMSEHRMQLCLGTPVLRIIQDTPVDNCSSDRMHLCLHQAVQYLYSIYIQYLYIQYTPEIYSQCQVDHVVHRIKLGSTSNKAYNFTNYLFTRWFIITIDDISKI